MRVVLGLLLLATAGLKFHSLAVGPLGQDSLFSSPQLLIATIEVGVPGSGGDIATGEGSVWVTSFGFPISRIDPASNKVVQQFVGEGGDALRVGAGSVWLSNLKAGVVWRLDPKRIQATLAE